MTRVNHEQHHAIMNLVKHLTINLWTKLSSVVPYKHVLFWDVRSDYVSSYACMRHADFELDNGIYGLDFN